MSNKIAAVILPYFGTWPVWIDLFLYSCGRNPMVDFYIFTDCPTPDKIYKNTIFTNISWAEYQEIISTSLTIRYSRENAYSLCDLKPFYGYIHKDIIVNYDFWGYCDMDVCFGDLSMIVNERNLKRYDVISTHADRISGHFALIRNNEKYCNLCFKIPEWQAKLESQEMFGLDEHFFTSLVFPQIKNIHRLYRRLPGILKKDYRTGYSLLMWPVNKITRYLFKEQYTSPAPIPGETWKYDLKTGKITDPSNRELPYIHYLFFKKTPFYSTEYYWREGFYKIASSDLQSSKGTILFNTGGIASAES